MDLKGRKDLSNNVWATSSRWWFLCFTTSFCWGVYGQKCWETMLFGLRNSWNSQDIYSPPESNINTLILEENWASTYVTYCRKIENTSNLEQK